MMTHRNAKARRRSLGPIFSREDDATRRAGARRVSSAHHHHRGRGHPSLPPLLLFPLLLLVPTFPTLALATATTKSSNSLLTGDAAAAAVAQLAKTDPEAVVRAARHGRRNHGGDDDATSPTVDAGVALLDQALRRDHDLKWASNAKRLVYACEGLAPKPEDERADDAAAAAAANATTTTTTTANGGIDGLAFPPTPDPSSIDAFKLHSRPGAAKTILLDYTGHTLRAGTVWADANANGDTPVTTPPWDLDGNPSTFAPYELRAIVSMWRQVSEDYAGFDVDVTTEEPAGLTDDQADAWLAKDGRGVRVAIGANNGWFPWNAGGVAYLQSFGQAEAGPVVFVFNRGSDAAAKVASHEVGHALSLYHHGTVAHDSEPAHDYYYGHGPWAPIMGVGYYRPVVQWCKGDYAYASEPAQDDLSLIGSYLPVSTTGEIGSLAAPVRLAAPANPSSPTIAVGVVRHGTDVHYYKFKTTAPAGGIVTLKLSVAPHGSTDNSRTHLGASVRVLRADTGATVSSFTNTGQGGIDDNIPSTADVSIDLPTGAGEYIVELSPSGNGQGPTLGYTAYGSSGTYALILGDPNGIVTDTPDPPPPPTYLTCRSATTLQLSTLAGNCDTGVAIKAEDVYTTSGAGSEVPTVTPQIGTILFAGDVVAFEAHLPSDPTRTTCTTVVTVETCPAIPDVVTCRSPTYTLSAATGGCAGIMPVQSELFTLTAGAPGSSARGSVDIAGMPSSGFLGPGLHAVVVTATYGGAACTSNVKVTPCKPVVVSTRVAVRAPSAPGFCAAAALDPALVVTSATLGQGALAVNVRTSTRGRVVPPPLKPGKYYAQLVYPPGNVLSAVSSSRFVLAVQDVEVPRATIKSSVVRDSNGFICARSRSTTRASTTACVSVSPTAAISVITLADNCPIASLVRSYTCAGAWCPTTGLPTSRATKLCVPVVAGQGRREVVWTMAVTDKGGNRVTLDLPIAAYHYRDPLSEGTTQCYSA